MNLLQRLGRGVEAGGLAGGGVAILLLATDVVRLRPFRTVTDLAAPLLAEGPVADASGAQLVGLAAVGAGLVLYSLVHLAAFLLLGVIATWVVPVASFWATLARGALFGAVACTGVFAAGRLVAGATVSVSSIGPLSLVLVNAMAGTIMAAVFAVHGAAGSGRGTGS